MKYIVQIVSASGSVSSFDLDAKDDASAKTIAKAQTELPDEDGTATIKVVTASDGKAASSEDVAVVASADSKAKAIARAAKKIADLPVLQARYAQLEASARERAIASGAPVIDKPAVEVETKIKGRG